MTLKLLDAEILDHIDGETELADEIEQAHDFTGVVYTSIMKAENAFHHSVTASAGTGVSRATRSQPVKLPKLALHSFSGDITQWITFWDSFRSVVHDNDQLTTVDKFNYLKSLLTGAALEAVAGLTLSASNYAEVVAIFEQRFGNRQQIIWTNC